MTWYIVVWRFQYNNVLFRLRSSNNYIKYNSFPKLIKIHRHNDFIGKVIRFPQRNMLINNDSFKRHNVLVMTWIKNGSRTTSAKKLGQGTANGSMLSSRKRQLLPNNPCDYFRSIFLLYTTKYNLLLKWLIMPNIFLNLNRSRKVQRGKRTGKYLAISTTVRLTEAPVILETPKLSYLRCYRVK